MNNFFRIFLALFFVIDALGIIPTYLQILKRSDPRKRTLIVLRELFFALLIMIGFHYLGIFLLKALALTQSTVEIASGIILFLISMRLIFHEDGGAGKTWGEKAPFIVPIATPLFAGPSVLAVIVVLSTVDNYIVMSAIALSWFVSSCILLLANPIYKFVGEKGLNACEKLMGLIVALIAVETFMDGVKLIITANQ